MKVFIDSANLDEIRRAVELGATGVTTNPTSMAKEFMQAKHLSSVLFDAHIKRICNLMLENVSVQVVNKTSKVMFEEGLELSALGHPVIVKVPATDHGIIACRRLSDDKIRVNVTLVFTPMQAILAANAGAYIVSPFLARTNDAEGYEGAGRLLINNIRNAYDRHGIKTKILAASIRSAVHVEQALQAGADICTMSLSVLESLYRNEQTEKGLAKMMADWNASQPQEQADWTTQTR